MNMFDSVYKRPEGYELDIEDMKGWTALPIISTETSTRIASIQDDLAEIAAQPGYTVGEQWKPVLVSVTEEGDQREHVLADLRFDTKRECQEFIADYIIGTGFYPTEDFD